MNDALKIDRKDNVAVVIRPVKNGEKLQYNDYENGNGYITALADIPIYHKVALADIAKGEKVIKYGEHIGEASETIKVGDYVHTHNVASVREDLRDNQ